MNDGSTGQAALEVLRRTFGHHGFRGSQGEIIERALSGGHSLVLMPTGMGKSVCYQVPALLGDGLTVVVSPLIALMKDQVDALRAKDVDAVYVNSSLDRAAREDRYRSLAEGRHRLLYVTPERFRKSDFLESISRRSISLLAVDEAHCISEWGHDFRPDYTRLREIRETLGAPTTMALTATATPEVQEDILRQLGLEAGEVRLYHEGVERPNLALQVHHAGDEGKKVERILELAEAARGSVIVYFALIKTLSRFSDLLIGRGLNHTVYHGKLEADPRRRIQDAFMSGRRRVVLATNAFGLGIDKEDIGLIVHVQVPGSLEAYMQEIGRAGRDGKPARCALLYDSDDLLIQMDFVEWANPTADYLGKLLSCLLEAPEEIRHDGSEYLAGRLAWKQRSDSRLDTALNLLDRHGVTEGQLDEGTLKVIGDLPPLLSDEELREEKRRVDLLRLQQVVEYASLDSCRAASLHEYFGFPETGKCGRCDACTGSNADL